MTDVKTATSVPYVDLARQHAPLKAELLEAIGRVIDHGTFILGPEVEAFEREVASLCETRFAIGVNSGTDALVLSLRAAGVGPGHEVITAPNSFVASASSIALVGATPVFADVGDDYNIDPDRIEAAITPRTRAILPVHLTGRPCAMDRISEIAAAHRLAVVEDCAQAVLASLHGRLVGAWGTFGCFSLHPLKTLNATGDGGVITTSDPAAAETLRQMRNIGLKTRDDCVMWSGNSRLDTLQAAVLLVKLKYLRRWTERRRENAAYYRTHLAGVPQVKVPTERPGEYAVYHTCVIEADRRDDLRAFLAARGIGSAIHYPVPIHALRAASGLGYAAGAFPVAERQAGRILSLPVFPELITGELDAVVSAIREFYDA
jgi:dTDP-4-amino-4,6-dideoxygalactose transaminase